MTLFTTFVESPPTSVCSTIVCSGGNNYSTNGAVTCSQKVEQGDTILEQDAGMDF
jgi:hypothetical protein